MHHYLLAGGRFGNFQLSIHVLDWIWAGLGLDLDSGMTLSSSLAIECLHVKHINLPKQLLFQKCKKSLFSILQPPSCHPPNP